jgi:RNA polymerase sigma-70 factor (ECF subfamily)
VRPTSPRRSSKLSASRTNRRFPHRHQGRDLAGQFLRATAFRPGCTARLIATRANGAPAFGFYVDDTQAGLTSTVGLLVLTLSATQISAMTRFDKDVAIATIPHF